LAHGRTWGQSVVSEIRIYVEGGGDARGGKDKVRHGFSEFFYKALGHQVKVIACGSRDDTYRDFQNGLKRHPHAFNVLLVDAEGAVSKDVSSWQHLQKRDNWSKPTTVVNEQCHLMVQTFEAWLMADRETLAKFYGQGFNVNSIPKRLNVEEIPKDDLEPALKAATQNTQKGEYHKINHAPDILAQLDATELRKKATHANRLLVILEQKLFVQGKRT